MAGGLLLAMAGAVVMEWGSPGAWRVAWPLFTLWALSPAIARWVSVPGIAARPVAFPPGDVRILRLIARRTWRFFETFVTAESHGLPPDNFQETPQPVVAQRTSPTNIGLYLLSAVSARDFGWLGTLDLVDRLEATMRTMRELEHHRGHLYNWYDTRDGHPLEPKYVSSVDSGNLAGALLTLANACGEIIDQAVPTQMGLEGIEDAALLLREAAHAADESRSAGLTERRRLDEALDVVMTVAAQQPTTPAEWVGRLAELESAVRSAANCARDVRDDGTETPRSAVLAGVEALRAAMATHARDLDTLMPWARLRVGEAAAPTMGPLATTMSSAELQRRCEAALHDLATRRAVMVNAGDTVTTGLRGIDKLEPSLDRTAAAADTLVHGLT